MPETDAGHLRSFLTELDRHHDGAIPFERFMQAALYDPQFGYYTRNIRTVGREGDFSTSATLTERLGQAVAAWAANRAVHFPRRRMRLVEIGGGDGSLALTVLKELRRLRVKVHYHLVETSPVLKGLQRRRLRFRGVRWHDEPASALKACGGDAVVFSNELVDAFPVRWMRLEPDLTWSEIHLSFSPDGGLTESFLPPRDPVPASTCLEAGRFRPGQRVEVHAAWRSWLSEKLAPFLRNGALLTIDYGGSAREIYRRRPGGSLRALFLHQQHTGPAIYRHFGRQDLTSDVNFEDLRAWGEEAGITTRSLQSQSNWLNRWAPLKDGDDAGAFIAHPEGAGEAFRVLEQCPASTE